MGEEEDKHLGGNVELVDEADLLADLLAGVGGEVELHLVQEGGGLGLGRHIFRRGRRREGGDATKGNRFNRRGWMAERRNRGGGVKCERDRLGIGWAGQLLQLDVIGPGLLVLA